MVYSTIYTNHSSSFTPQELFEETGSALDDPSMAGSSRTGLLITMIPAHSGQVLESGHVPLTTQWSHQHPVSSRYQCIGYASGGEAGWLWFGALTTNLQFPSTFFAILLRWTMVEPGWFLPLFFCNWMFSNFSVNSSKITFDCDIFLSFGIFGCHCMAIVFCMIIAVLK